MIKVMRQTDDRFPLPIKMSAQAGGFDIHASEDKKIWPRDFIKVPTGFIWEIPEGYVGVIRARSGLASRFGLEVMAGVIDSDYRGEVQVMLINLGERPVELKRGERIAQMLILATHPASEVAEVKTLTYTERGMHGFGSTGTS